MRSTKGFLVRASGGRFGKEGEEGELEIDAELASEASLERKSWKPCCACAWAHCHCWLKIADLHSIQLCCRWQTVCKACALTSMLTNGCHCQLQRAL